MASENFPPQFAELRGLVCAPGVAGLLGGCVAPRATPDPVTDPPAPEGASAPMIPMLGADAVTRETNARLAAVGADKLEGLKPMKMDDMGGMQGMDHSKMGVGMEGMDHSKMPGMKDTDAAMPGSPAPADKTAVADEMKMLSDEMKKTSDVLRKKSDAAKKPATPVPQP